ncbi:ATP-binding protein [Brevundimonas subvibrioides]|uniref:histidine kinase n=1 Tax=Brevundimonas subvibrioides (strain ATCC 15264 / DSM 4735 / LMG 14903 / NBRC 16000 / CB 81) TaxID=633149 RepID=D9QMI7_BRESC|nr:ATP-binding protein [Brevundimonas subvibrioides]ADL00157.1 integral membrane sensor hybrid histidine kinase [Brevundimonas subvibrioides ATCC 15264]
MDRLTSLGALLSATAHERRRQVPVRILLALLVAWALYSAGQGAWIGAWLAAVAAIQGFEIVAMFRFRRADARPGAADVVLALTSTMAMAALFAGTSVAIWAIDGRGLEGFAMLIIAGGLLTNVASGIEARSIFYVGAAPYLVALVAMPLMAMAGSTSGDPVLTSLGSILFIGAIVNVYGRVHAARVAELGALTEAEMRVEQAQGAMADRAAMAAIISHELRTPVSAILAGAQVIRDDAAPAQRQETAELIVDASALMTRMLNDLLDHSKMEAGAMSLESRDFDLSRMIGDTERFWRAQVAEKGLVLKATVLEPGQWLRGDPYRLRQILNNLMSNAIKFTAQGEVSVEVAVTPVGAGERAVTITVRDEGAGIAPEAMDRLFTPFAQGSSEVARTYGGTGLGLKVSRDLARLMGGDLTVDSAPGQGAAFTLSVRLAAGAPVTEAEATATTALDLRPSLRILAVDDHEINRRTLALVLQPLGVDLSTASDGMLALDLLARQAFDVVLMDVNMPGIDGNETTRRLRASGGPNADIPVIGFSAGTEAAQIAACRAAGMTDWLAKPLEPHRLYDALHRATAPETERAAA